MAITSIPISGLNVDPVIQSVDFIPIVNSSSLTTYRATVQSFGYWMSVSGSSLYSTTSLSSTSSLSASWASQSFVSLSSSFSSQSFAATSASWASQSFVSLSSSFSSQSFAATSASWASQSFAATSASWASQSLSSSYVSGSGFLFGTSSFAITASWANSTGVLRSPITFITPINIAATPGSTGIHLLSLSQSYFGSTSTSNVNGVILQAHGGAGTTTIGGTLSIASSSVGDGATPRILFTWTSQNYSAGTGPQSGFGFFPVSSSTSNVNFWYSSSNLTISWRMDLLGYF